MEASYALWENHLHISPPHVPTCPQSTVYRSPCKNFYWNAALINWFGYNTLFFSFFLSFFFFFCLFVKKSDWTRMLRLSLLFRWFFSAAEVPNCCCPSSELRVCTVSSIHVWKRWRTLWEMSNSTRWRLGHVIPPSTYQVLNSAQYRVWDINAKWCRQTSKCMTSLEI